MATFHLVRHGQHNLGGGRLAGRTPGVGLTEHGRAEIAAVADLLTHESIGTLVSSPLQRTQESAEIIGARLGLAIETRPEFIELDFGEWTGATYDSIRSDPRWPRWNAHRSLTAIPGGESMRAVQRRAVEAWLDLDARLGDGIAAIVSHGDVIRSMLLFALGMPLEFYTRVEVGLASVSTVRIDHGGFRVTTMNHRPYQA